MKNVSLVNTKINKVKAYKLLDSKGQSLDYFETFQSIIMKKYSSNTVLTYSHNLALFIDYLEEINIVLAHEVFSQKLLVECLEAFPEWLLYGDQSGNDIIHNLLSVIFN